MPHSLYKVSDCIFSIAQMYIGFSLGLVLFETFKLSVFHSEFFALLRFLLLSLTLSYISYFCTLYSFLKV